MDLARPHGLRAPCHAGFGGVAFRLPAVPLLRLIDYRHAVAQRIGRMLDHTRTRRNAVEHFDLGGVALAGAYLAQARAAVLGDD